MPSRRRLPSLVLIASLLLSAVCAESGAQTWSTSRDDPVLVIEVWTELDPLVADGGLRPVPREVAVERLLDEAVFILSGMIYGFRFVYVPRDPTRRVDEQFDLTPYATIVRGDPRLDVLQTWVSDDRLYARISYTVDEQQRAWYRGWRSAANASATGVGTAGFFEGPAVKHETARDAIRGAIHSHVRSLELNRPRRIEGAVLIAEGPISGIRSGHYETRLSVLLQVDEITRYGHY